MARVTVSYITNEMVAEQIDVNLQNEIDEVTWRRR
jgi:hypothetical protein